MSIYSTMKYSAQYFLIQRGAMALKPRTLIRDVLGIFSLWLVSLVFLLIVGAHGQILIVWTIIILTAIPIYGYSFYKLIPKSLDRTRPFFGYWLRIGLLIALATLLLTGLLIPVLNDTETAVNYTLFNAAVQLIIITPLVWILYKRHQKSSQAVIDLKKELGQSNANVDLLRSQINPHFLFNAFNTIYGTAIQEGAERTSEAIEKLGDMMRFMLHENTQETISLAREIDYLTNYISLQRLRTDPTLSLQVHTDVAPSMVTLPIAPMLLIPFVENAFKHGISLRAPSHINISVEVRGSTLLLDVHNSKHPKPENDPEKHKSGIGLLNVQQRLQLVYPAKHELIIRETQCEFFIHLTIQLA